MSAVDVAAEPDKFETCLKRTMGPKAAGCCIPIYKILNFIWQYLVTPFLPLTDVASDIITVVTWYNWCQEGKQDFDCHWWILGVVFILLPICIMLVAIAIGMKKDTTCMNLLLSFFHPIYYIVLHINAKCTNEKNLLDGMNFLKLVDVIFESIPQASMQWFLIVTHGELYQGTGTLLGQKYDIF